jgi:hypothetical protein
MQPGSELVATHEWNLAADLPVVGANLGLEAITWIPDTILVASSFFASIADGAPLLASAEPATQGTTWSQEGRRRRRSVDTHRHLPHAEDGTEYVDLGPHHFMKDRHERPTN